ncbi:MAG: ABC-F family ATP-binding cassette domain-containing protein [Bacillota bacterium]|nr:ABC-F family ATP-binding cassette domain-containing protein [Bacillota bacterium]
MDLLTVRHVSRTFSEKTLLTDINLIIHEEEKTGLVGVNGSGKSTLLKIIAGVLDADSGEIRRSNSLKAGYLPQNPEYDPKLTVIEQAISYAPDVEEYMLKSYLNKMGMDRYDMPMSVLSGGQRKKVAIAAVMAGNNNLLVLDEPTNHMDNDIIEWMEERLIEFKGAIFMITHDRYFLERVTDRICEIENGKLITYEGNYDAYLTAKAERLQMAMASERKRAAIYKKELRWIRWSAPARTTKAKGRIERFHKLEDGKQTFDNPQVEISAASSRLGRKIIEINNLGKAYDGEYYIRDFNYNILRNDRIGIVGPNGCGKTTLLKMIMGEVKPDEGNVEIGQTVKIGYFSQEAEEMDGNVRVIKFVEDIATSVKTDEGYFSASQMLEKFLFPSYMHSVKIEKLSGGEKRRLYLLSVLMQAPNVLILDEPTNDLDIDTLTILEDYLDSFPGAVIIVSHDRYFLDRLVVRTFAFEENGHIGHYTGGYSKYMNEKEAREAEQSEKATDKSVDKKGETVSSTTSSGRNSRAKKLKFSYNEKREYETIDDDIAELEEKISLIEKEINLNSSDYASLTQLSEEKAKLDEELLAKMERWEYLNELAERIERGETVPVE